MTQIAREVLDRLLKDAERPKEKQRAEEDDLRTLADELLDAIRADDPSAVADALRAGILVVLVEEDRRGEKE